MEVSYLEGSIWRIKTTINDLPSAATLKSYPGASACTGKTVKALCHFKCNTAIDSIGLILNAMMSSSESWLNRLAIDCVYSVCVCALFLRRLCAWRTLHAMCVPFCVFHLCEEGSGSPEPGLLFSWLILPSFSLSLQFPLFLLCAQSMPAELKWTATFLHKLFNNYDLQACPLWQRQWKWCMT